MNTTIALLRALAGPMSKIRRTWAIVSVIALATLLAPRPAAGQAPGDGVPAPGEAALEARLIAPCCWTQTIDVHESEPVRALRQEIRARLRAGERPDAIEEDFVGRYGEGIRAFPKGDGPGAPIPLVVGLMMLAAGAALVIVVRRWLRVAGPGWGPPAIAASSAPAEGDAYDGKLDDELRALDD